MVDALGLLPCVYWFTLCIQYLTEETTRQTAHWTDTGEKLESVVLLSYIYYLALSDPFYAQNMPCIAYAIALSTVDIEGS